MREFDRANSGLLMSSFSAGLDIGFGPFLMAVFLTLSEPGLSEAPTALITAGLYSMGFLFVILGRSELFTEHTTMAVLPVLSGQAGITDLLRVWLLVWVGNLAGAVTFAALGSFIGPELGVIDPAAFSVIATALIEHEWWVMLLSAILAGWLMGLLGWLVGAAGDTISRVVIVVLVAGSIGLAGLHHSIAGAVEVLFAVFAGEGGIGSFTMFLVWATVGNAVGGSVFVAILKYAHVVRSEREPDELTEEGD